MLWVLGLELRFEGSGVGVDPKAGASEDGRVRAAESAPPGFGPVGCQ